MLFRNKKYIDYTDFKKLPIEQQNSYNNGKMFYDALSGCAYKGFNNNQYDNLLGLFMKYEGTTEKISEQYKYYDFYPFLIKLSEGQRALLKVGLPQFLSTCLIPVELMNSVFDNMFGKLNESAETEEEIIKYGDTVSVYKDVDRSLYIKDNGVAMTSKAIDAAKSKPLEHIVPDDVQKAQLICTCLAGAAGGVAAVSMITIAGMSKSIYLEVNKALSQATNTNLTNILGEVTSKEVFFENGVAVGLERRVLGQQGTKVFALLSVLPPPAWERQPLSRLQVRHCIFNI